ncbi:hypothetical protein Scep_030544 [Stephania cephalantha]|uniref:Leucine-rich repeat-containing N-terminal plant-type domain-containing protein n=1 Tax=Stephania cephalantha TaxID=152367 RepID=A0AAP0HD87_9MAGN
MKKQLAFLFVTVNFLYILPLALSILHPNDFLALQSIRKSLSDLPGSTFFSDWDFTADPCTFSGVLCTAQTTPSTPRRVISLNLGDPRASSPGLSGRLSPSLSRLPHSSPSPSSPAASSAPSPPSLPPSPASASSPSPATSSPAPSPPNRPFTEPPNPRPQLQPTHRPNPPVHPNPNSIDQPHPLPQPPLRIHPQSLQLQNPNSSQSPTQQPLRLSHAVHSPLLAPTPLLIVEPDRRFVGPGFEPAGPDQLPRLEYEPRNGFSGPVRPVRPVEAQTVDLSFNALTGQVSEMFSTVENLYLNNNGFEGEVPRGLVDRVLTGEIKLLYLQHNYLTGIEMDPTAAIPESSSMCLMYNCMVPPVETPCPRRAGKQKVRPWKQCNERRRKGKKRK